MVRRFLFFMVVFGCGIVNAKEVVVVGDSLSCGPFGKYLLQDLEKKGETVTLYCAVSSAPANWLNGKNPSGQKCQTMTSANPVLKPCGGNGQVPKYSSILAKHKDARVIIALGTNSLMSPKADSSYKKMATATQATGSSCEWIGPPRLNPSQSKGFPPGRIAALNKNVNPFYDSMALQIDRSCNLIDSRDATAAGTPGNQTVDGVHRTDAAGKYWVREISGQLNKSSTEETAPSAAQ